jgi:dihydroflavonol-4-reductase
MRALVIGATGFIGLNLVDALLAEGIEVRATRRPSSPTIFLRKRKVEMCDASLEDVEQLKRAMEGCDVVYLAGGYYPRYSLDLKAATAEGVSGVRNACQAARAVGVLRFIYTSSIATLERTTDRLATEQDIPETQPTGSVYRAVKWSMERELDSHAARGLPAVTLLPGGCIGPWDLRLGTGGVLVQTVRGMLPFWVEGTVALVDVTDVARAHVRALHAKGSRFCLAPHAADFGELLRLMVERYGGKVPERVDAEVAKRLADEAEWEAAPRKGRVAFPRELVDMILTGQPVSCALAEQELALRFTPLPEALDRAHTFFTRFHYLSAPTDKEGQRHAQPGR